MTSERRLGWLAGALYLMKGIARRIPFLGRAFRLVELAYLKDLPRMVISYVRGEYTGLSKPSILLMVAALLYALMPLDFLPDLILPFGFADDLAFFAFVVAALRKEVEKYREWRKQTAQMKKNILDITSVPE